MSARVRSVISLLIAVVFALGIVAEVAPAAPLHGKGTVKRCTVSHTKLGHKVICTTKPMIKPATHKGAKGKMIRKHHVKCRCVVSGKHFAKGMKHHVKRHHMKHKACRK